MELYILYNAIATVLLFSGLKATVFLPIALGVSVAVWLTLFILQGFGLYTMAKNQNVKRRWTAFVPFANVWLMGKIAGECNFFGQRMKRGWVYTMISQIIVGVFCALMIAAEVYLFTVCGEPHLNQNLGTIYWPGLDGFSKIVSDFYDISGFIYSIIQLVYEIFMLILIMALYRKYLPKNYIFLSFLSWFVPLSRYIVIFVLRNRKAIDFEAYMRERREAYMRQHQQYRNSYGNPYGNPYGQNPYQNGQNPYQNGQENGGNTSSAEEPFAEFSSSQNRGNTTDGQEQKSDDFFR